MHAAMINMGHASMNKQKKNYALRDATSDLENAQPLTKLDCANTKTVDTIYTNKSIGRELPVCIQSDRADEKRVSS